MPERNGVVECDVWHLARISVGIPGEHRDSEVQSKAAVRVDEAFKEPRAEESCCAGDKNAAAARLIAERCGLRQDVIQVSERQWVQFTSIPFGRISYSSKSYLARAPA